MTITRVVQVQFKQDLSSEDISQTLEQVRAMKDKCVSTSDTPYIKSLKVGKDQSPEPLNNGYTHQFVMEFADAADRDYYSGKDKYHQSVIAVLTPQIEKVQILDIVDGQD